MWAYFQQASGIDMRNASTASANLDEINSRQAHGQSTALFKTRLPSGLKLCRNRRTTVRYQTRFRCRASHIKGHHINSVSQARGIRGTKRASSGPRFKHTNGHTLTQLARNHTTVRLHDV